MTEVFRAFEAALLEIAELIEEGRVDEAGPVYDTAVRALPGGRLPEQLEALRRAVTDLMAAAELRRDLDPSWRALASALQDDPAPLREHLASLDAAGQLPTVLGELRSAAPDAWPWIAPHIPVGWQPPHRELSPAARWWVVGGLLVAVFAFLTLGAWLAPRGERLPSGFSPEGVALQVACDAPVTDADRFACAQSRRLATALEDDDCEQAVRIAETLDGTEGETADTVRSWAQRALVDRGCADDTD